MAAVYDLGCLIYFLVPTAPPWWAGENGYLEERRAAGDGRGRRGRLGAGLAAAVRRAGRQSLGGDALAPLRDLAAGGDAALGDGRVPGALGWSYALTLGFALVYLCEHYVADLAAGAALVALVRRGEPFAEPLALVVSRGVQRLERVANG